MLVANQFWQVRSVPGSPSWPFYRGRFLSRYLFVCDYVNGKRVLDVASGAGYGSRILAEVGKASSVSGVELEQDAVDYANHNFASPAVSFRQGDARDVATYFAESTFDVASSMGTLEHIPEPQRFAAAVRKVLKPGGVWLLTMLNPARITEKDPFHHQEYDLATFRAFLEQQFNSVEIYGLQTPEGPLTTTPLRKTLDAVTPRMVKNAAKRILGPALTWRVALNGVQVRESSEYHWSKDDVEQSLEFLAVCANR